MSEEKENARDIATGMTLADISIRTASYQTRTARSR